MEKITFCQDSDTGLLHMHKKQQLDDSFPDCIDKCLRGEYNYSIDLQHAPDRRDVQRKNDDRIRMRKGIFL